MRSVVGTCLVGVVLATVGCQSQAPVQESLTFSFESSGSSGNGGFVCYPSAYGGWLCEAGTADGGGEKKALHIDPETESMRAMFELVKDAAAVAEEPERVAERQRQYASFERSLDKPLRVSKSWLEVAYTGGGGKEVFTIDGWKLREVLRSHPAITHLYRETIRSLGLSKGYWYRDLAPTPEEIANGQYQTRLKQLKDPIIILSEQPQDWVPTPGQYVQLMGVARNPQKGFSCVETGSHGDWLTPLEGRWPEDVAGHRVSLIGVVELYTPEKNEEGRLRQDYCGPVLCVSVFLWERVADE